MHKVTQSNNKTETISNIKKMTTKAILRCTFFLFIFHRDACLFYTILTDKRNATRVTWSRNYIHHIYFKTNFINLTSNNPLVNVMNWKMISPSVFEQERPTSHYPNFTFHKNQYLVKAPLLLNTATHRRRTEAMSLLMDTRGIRCHSSVKAARN